MKKTDGWGKELEPVFHHFNPAESCEDCRWGRYIYLDLGHPEWNRNAANRTAGVRVQPQINTRTVERVLARHQLPDFFAVAKRRQAHRTLASDVYGVGLLQVLENGTHPGFISVAMPAAGAAQIRWECFRSPAESPEGDWRALEKKEQEVNRGGYDD